MTNHHCARESVAHVSKPGENLLEQGFFSKSLAEERPVSEDFHADQLIALVDVTASVAAQAQASLSDEQRAQQRDDILKQVGDSMSPRPGAESRATSW